MNFLQRKTTWTNAELAVLKLAVGSAFLLIGAYLHHYIRIAWIPILFVSIITIGWALALWIKKMKREKPNISQDN
jgi:carbon starvation protein CstA